MSFVSHCVEDVRETLKKILERTEDIEDALVDDDALESKEPLRRASVKEVAQARTSQLLGKSSPEESSEHLSSACQASQRSLELPFKSPAPRSSKLIPGGASSLKFKFGGGKQKTAKFAEDVTSLVARASSDGQQKWCENVAGTRSAVSSGTVSEPIHNIAPPGTPM